MVITALLLGGLTAYYWGVEAGCGAAVVSALAFAVAMFMPAHALKIYAAAAAYGGFVLLAGPKLAPARKTNALEVSKWLRKGHKQWQKWSSKFRK